MAMSSRPPQVRSRASVPGPGGIAPRRVIAYVGFLVGLIAVLRQAMIMIPGNRVGLVGLLVYYGVLVILLGLVAVAVAFAPLAYRDE